MDTSEHPPWSNHPTTVVTAVGIALKCEKFVKCKNYRLIRFVFYELQRKSQPHHFGHKTVGSYAAVIVATKCPGKELLKLHNYH